MWLMFRDMVAQALALVVLSQPATGDPAPATKPTPPLEYRGDTMQVFTKPNRAVLHSNVVIRRGNLVVCCENFEGLADADWGWERFICTENVVAQRNDETMWADKAEFILETSDLHLTGKPILQRGKSFLEGTRIVVDTERDTARIEKPRGRIHSAKETTTARRPVAIPDDLPTTCPLPVAPELSR